MHASVRIRGTNDGCGGAWGVRFRTIRATRQPVITLGSPGDTVASVTTPHDSLGDSVASVTTPHDNPGRMSASITTPHDSLGRMSASTTTPHDSPGRMSAGTTTPHDSPGRMSASITTGHDSLGRMSVLSYYGIFNAINAAKAGVAINEAQLGWVFWCEIVRRSF